MCNPTVEHSAPAPAPAAHSPAHPSQSQPQSGAYAPFPQYPAYQSADYAYAHYTPTYAGPYTQYYGQYPSSFQTPATVPSTSSKQLSLATGEAAPQPSRAKKSQTTGHVFVHNPYSLPACEDECEDEVSNEESFTPTATEAVHDTESARVFCSGKGIPAATDEEFLEQIAPIRHLVTEIFRPRGGRKEFLYVELANPEAADVLLSWHPMKFRGSRLNFSRAKPARGQARGPAAAA